MEKRFSEPLSTEELIALQKDFSYLQNRIDETEANWLELSEKLETIS